MITVILAIGFFVIGLLIRPMLVKFLKEYFEFSSDKLKQFEVKFRIEFYSQPSLHHHREKGVLIKSPPITLQLRAEDESEALDMIELLVKQEVKGELISIKELDKL